MYTASKYHILIPIGGTVADDIYRITAATDSDRITANGDRRITAASI